MGILQARSNKVVLITGGARGLGLAIAIEYAGRGAAVLLCSRTLDDLSNAEDLLRKRVPDALVVTYVCDVSKQEQIEVMMTQISRQFGKIDVLVNCAGVMISEPLETVSENDLRESFDSNFWAMVRLSFAAIPVFTKNGRILNITSAGGLAPAPHLMAYGASKFAAVGFSTSLALSLKKKGISVTTAVPPLMRTGSFLHAKFKGQHRAEYAWYARLSTLPGLTIPAHRAARRLVDACESRKYFVSLNILPRVAHLMFAAFPNWTIRILSQIDRWMPRASTLDDPSSYTGEQIRELSGIKAETRAGARAATRWNERGNSRRRAG